MIEKENRAMTLIPSVWIDFKTQTHTQTYTHTQAYIHTHKHTYTQTYTHTHAHTQSLKTNLTEPRTLIQ